MTKYARLVDHSETHDGSDLRVVDVFDPSVYNPRPSWGQTDSALMDRIFENHKKAWIAAGHWFVQVHDSVIDYCKYSGNDPMNFANYTLPTIVVPLPVYKKLIQASVLDIMNEVFGDTRYLAVLTALAALNTDAWIARMKKINNQGAVFTRQQVIDFMTAARAADVPTSGTKITVAEITAAASHSSWVTSGGA